MSIQIVQMAVNKKHKSYVRVRRKIILVQHRQGKTENVYAKRINPNELAFILHIYCHQIEIENMNQHFFYHPYSSRFRPADIWWECFTRTPLLVNKFTAISLGMLSASPWGQLQICENDAIVCSFVIRIILARSGRRKTQLSARFKETNYFERSAIRNVLNDCQFGSSLLQNKTMDRLAITQTLPESLEKLHWNNTTNGRILLMQIDWHLPLTRDMCLISLHVRAGSHSTLSSVRQRKRCAQRNHTSGVADCD